MEPDFFKKINLFTNQKPTYRNIENKLIVTKGEMWRGRINQELGMNVYTVLYTRQISSKDLQYSKGNSTQYSVIIYVRKESEKE